MVRLPPSSPLSHNGTVQSRALLLSALLLLRAQCSASRSAPTSSQLAVCHCWK